MDIFDLSDDNLFSDPAFEAVLAQAERQSHSLASRHSPPLEELDDSLLDQQSFSQALLGADTEPVTSNSSQHQTTTDSDEFDTSGFGDDELWAAATVFDTLRDDCIVQSKVFESVSFSQFNRTRPLVVKYEPWAKIPHLGENEFGEPDFQDPEVEAALEDAERCALQSTTVPSHESAAELVQVTRAELDALKRNAFIAGQANHHRLWRRRYVFDFFKLPLELRMEIYHYALQDSNPKTAGGHVQALPVCHRTYDDVDCFHHTSVWPDADNKPWINTALLCTCKQIYYEARDKILYRGRHFEAKAILTKQFKNVMREAPRMVFWQHMQHLHLILRPTDHREQWGRHVLYGVEHLTALMRGGKKLKSFQLSWEFTQFSDRIDYFRDLRISGSIVITQHFDDPTIQAGKEEEKEREGRIRCLLLSMQGLQPDATTEYDVVVSQSPDRIGPHAKRSQMQIRMSTR